MKYGGREAHIYAVASKASRRYNNYTNYVFPVTFIYPEIKQDKYI